jgi:hypothetical protein
MIRIVYKETLQSLVTTFTNMELVIRVKRFTRTAEAIANYVGREYPLIGFFEACYTGLQATNYFCLKLY